LSLVSLVHTKESNQDSFEKAIERSLSLIQFNFKIGCKRVVIKPNLCYYYDYSTGETTDPKFVSALIDVLRENLSSNPEIFVVESDASAMKCRYVFKMLGYEKMTKEKGVTLVNLSKEENKNVEINILDKHFRFSIPQTIYRSDLLVNVPKIKYMGGPKITCALKNIYGCNAYPKKFIYHTRLNEAIVGINKLIKTNLVVVDGIIVNGIGTKRLGLVMASEDPVAIDTAASRIIGLNPKSVKHIALASKEGIGNLGFIQKGESLTYFKDLFPRKRFKNKVHSFLASVYFRYFNM
jgi:uncharacterized protein (DUF362 family)